MFLFDILIGRPINDTISLLRDLFKMPTCDTHKILDSSGDIAKITDNVYITSFNTAYNERINGDKFGAVIDMCRCKWPDNAVYKIPVYKYPIDDKHIYPGDEGFVLPDVYGGAAKINELVRDGKKVLVNCMAGMNRSAFVICAYLIQYKDMSPQSAIALVSNANITRNMQTLTNHSFVRILNDPKYFP